MIPQVGAEFNTSDSVSELAESITRGSSNVYTIMKSIFDYMRDEFVYDENSPGIPKSCEQTMADAQGDCDDQSILYISMLRSLGIPAWLEFGPLYDSNAGDWGGHAWAEVYIPLASGGGQEVTIDIVNGEFLVRNCNRFEEWKSDGVSQHLEEYYYLLTHIPTDYYPLLSVSFDESYSGVYTASSDTVSGLIASTFVLSTVEE